MHIVNITPGVFRSNFLALNASMILALLQAILQCFACSMSLLIIINLYRPPLHVVCMPTVSDPQVSDFIPIKGERHLSHFRPFTNLVKVPLNDVTVSFRDGASIHLKVIDKFRYGGFQTQFH